MSIRFRIVLSSAFALLGIVSCLAYADTVRTEADKVRADALERFGGEIAQLVVAEQTLEVGDVISERNVRVRDWVADLAPAEAVVSLDEVVGREVSVPVSKGVPLTKLNFRDASTLMEVPSGHVAVSVPVTDKLGISRGVTRGARVSAYEVSDSAPRLIATDREVLSELGTQTSMSQQLTIAVLPDDVSAVLGASASGELRLVIPADDVEVPEEESVAAPEEIVPNKGEEQQ
ncbi:MAG: SAF domain-containing protein [Atopobiaceae bacterium]|nr:SAF domain-containing protein [Atopobiaceae bacterium]